MLLYQMIDTGTGAAAYYADILQAVLDPGRPGSLQAAGDTTSFLDRLEAKWLQHAWGDGRHPAELARARAAGRHLPDIQLRYATLLGRLGPALDGPGTLAEADAWYCILEGTREPSVAEAQAMALTELAARAATALDGEPRVMLLAADDFPAVAGRVPSPTCTSAADRWASGSRSPRRPGRAWAAMTMSGTGSRPPRTAGCSCCGPLSRAADRAGRAPPGTGHRAQAGREHLGR